MTLTIGVDVGGTKVLGGVVTPDGEVLATERRATPLDDAPQTAVVIAEVVAELTDAYPDVEAVGVGAAGWIDAQRSTVMFAPNVAWRNEPLRDRIADKVGLPVVVENDANTAAWAEYRFGAARGMADVLLITVGTGIGGGIITGGALFRGAYGVAAEFGHVRVVPDGLPCGCGRRGCFEQYCSGRALVREARALAEADPHHAMRMLALAGGDPDSIQGPQVTQAAEEGDPAAREAFAVIGKWLGQGLADLVSIWDPGLIVVGGGVAESGDLLLGPTRDAYVHALGPRVRLPVAEIHVAELGNSAGLIGAADLARMR
ncbi:MAG TPA: ROK family glucokinase [Mycobacteriales bacterium]|nr:ROK family glucokinase [Mycobacteriales bacterium]